ncbi:hypothetical protein FMM05_17775 [Flavobacterium zepuense]|uniref:Uncharacterized protein n=1 Tax=Flavobacterium zepuense TaxID=2593302 RepID=A0A552UVX8_9FLAO|nr:hypothetical protein [Flavobacterium zepuense]TRW22355.1 hypothetical protein FMM05_17775 [Flavobacterium zepuense]
MDKLNIEEQLQRKFKDRAITPSPDAWTRVAYNRQNNKKKNRKNILWYCAAACFILTAGIVMFILMQNNVADKPQQLQVVTAPESVLAPEPVAAPVITPADTFAAPTSVAITAHKNNPDEATRQPITASVKDTLTAVAVNTPLPQLELLKANEIAYTLTQMSQKNGQVTQQEVDSLLLSAQKEIALERLKNTNKPTSNTALLNEAETEVNTTFREKALNIFKHKFKTIRIAGKN